MTSTPTPSTELNDISRDELLLEINHLEQQLVCKRNQLRALNERLVKQNEQITRYSEHFDKRTVEKYCRQIILSEFGVKRQLATQRAKILIVGAGGLGCPCALYLAACGVQTITLIDADIVSFSNLHRQILYGESDVGRAKVEVAKEKLESMHGQLTINAHNERLNASNCVDLFKTHDIIIDCTDSVATRYLVNDVGILLRKPLVLGNAIRVQGQYFSVVPKQTPCYRCLFPEPPNPVCVGSCGEDGVLGVTTGVIGLMQAFLALKLITDDVIEHNTRQMTLFDDGKFRYIKFREPRVDCVVCGIYPSVDLEHLPDYDTWVLGGVAPSMESYPPVRILSDDDYVDVRELKRLIDGNARNYLLVDVRPSVEYEMCRLKPSTNLPLSKLAKNRDMLKDLIDDSVIEAEKFRVLFICRRGNDSQLAMEFFKTKTLDNQLKNVQYADVYGGLYAWHEFIDDQFPTY